MVENFEISLVNSADKHFELEISWVRQKSFVFIFKCSSVLSVESDIQLNFCVLPQKSTLNLDQAIFVKSVTKVL